MPRSPFETTAWERAKKRCTEDLDVNERAIFDGASPENLFYEASALRIRHQMSSRSRATMQKLRPVIECLETYGSVIDAFSNVEPLVLSPIWGSIRVLLHIASEFGRYFDRIVDMFSEIGQVLPRLRDYERLFPNHERLVYAIANVYTVLIEFCIAAKKIFRSAKRREFPSWFPVSFWPRRMAWRPFNRQFDEYMQELRGHRDTVETEAGISQMVEGQKSHELIRQQKAIADRRNEEKTRQRLFEMLSDINHFDEHGKRFEKHHPGTGEWFTDSNGFTMWYESDSSSCLWCYGIPGSGKTTLASKVVENLRLDAHVHLAYIYCDYSKTTTLQATAVLGSFIKQLLERVEIPKAIQSEIEKAYRNISGAWNPALQQLKSVLLSIGKLFTNRQLYFVVDGLDECSIENRSKLLEVLITLMECDEFTTKAFVTSREETDIREKLGTYPSVRISESNNTADISLFIRDSVQSLAKIGRLKVGDPRLFDEIIDALINGAGGMFLWVTFQLQDICKAITDHGIRELLRNLPRDLATTYARILHKIALEPEREAIAPKLLQWMVCAKRPLSIEELKEAVAFGPADRFWDASKIPSDSGRLLEACGHLITIDDEGTLSLAHYTVKQFLLSKPTDSSLSKFHFDTRHADIEVGKVCVSYLSFSDFETQLMRVPVASSISHNPMNILESANMNQSWPSNSKPIDRAIASTYRYFHGGAKHQPQPLLNINYDRHLGLRHAHKEESLHKKYQLLDYVIKNWVWHTMEFTSKDGEIWPLFYQMALAKQMPFDFRPWRGNFDSTDFPHQSLFLWAVHAGHTALLELLEQPLSGPPILQYVKNAIHNSTVMSIFPLHENGRVGKYLLHLLRARESTKIEVKNTRRGVWSRLFDDVILGDISSDFFDEIRTVDQYNNTALHRAAHHGWGPMVSKLLRKGLSSRALNIYGMTPLHLAADKGSNDVIKILIQSGADVSAKDNYGLTPLHFAATSSSNAAVRELLRNGADVQVANNYGTTPLHLAAKSGALTVVLSILERGAKKAALDIHGSTPLSLAQNQGDKRLNAFLSSRSFDPVLYPRNNPRLLGRYGSGFVGNIDKRKLFNDESVVSDTGCGNITEVTIGHGWMIDYLSVTYERTGYATRPQHRQHGGRGGQRHTFPLSPGEYIVSLEVNASEERLFGIMFLTNYGRRSPFYGRTCGDSYTLKPDTKYNLGLDDCDIGLLYFKGTCDDTGVRGLQAHFFEYSRNELESD